MTGQDKSGVIGFVLGISLVAVIVYLINRDKKEQEAKQPPITDNAINVAVEAYKKAMADNQPQANLDEINNQLSTEFGLTVEFKPAINKFYIYDLSGKKVKETQ